MIVESVSGRNETIIEVESTRLLFDGDRLVSALSASGNSGGRMVDVQAASTTTTLDL